MVAVTAKRTPDSASPSQN